MWLAEHRGAVLPPISVVPRRRRLRRAATATTACRWRGRAAPSRSTPSSRAGERAAADHGCSASISSPIARLSWLALWPPALAVGQHRDHDAVVRIDPQVGLRAGLPAGLADEPLAAVGPCRRPSRSA